jgi:hypothetical protein
MARLPSEGKFGFGAGELERARGQVLGSSGIDCVVVSAFGVTLPFAGQENFRLAIYQAHGDGAVIECPAETAFSTDTGSQWEKRQGEYAEGDDEIDLEAPIPSAFPPPGLMELTGLHYHRAALSKMLVMT